MLCGETLRHIQELVTSLLLASAVVVYFILENAPVKQLT